jgi:uncharacterized coiled-coil protein SlyX
VKAGKIVEDTSRVETLEIKVSHLERAIQELSDVVYRQQQALDGALEMNRQLREQLEDLETRSSDPTAVEIPPHY